MGTSSGDEGSLYVLVGLGRSMEIGSVGWIGTVDGDWFGTDSGEACACIIDGGAGEGMWGA